MGGKVRTSPCPSQPATTLGAPCPDSGTWESTSPDGFCLVTTARLHRLRKNAVVVAVLKGDEFTRGGWRTLLFLIVLQRPRMPHPFPSFIVERVGTANPGVVRLVARVPEEESEPPSGMGVPRIWGPGKARTPPSLRQRAQEGSPTRKRGENCPPKRPGARFSGRKIRALRAVPGRVTRKSSPSHLGTRHMHAPHSRCR